MTTGRINQVATSRPVPNHPKASWREARSVPTARLYRSHRVRERTECFRETTDCSKSVSQRTTSRVQSQALRLGRTSRRASCCLLAVFLERSYRTASVQAPPLQCGYTPRGRKQSWAKVSLRCAARAASLPPEGRLSLPLSHAIGSELMLGIA